MEKKLNRYADVAMRSWSSEKGVKVRQAGVKTLTDLQNREAIESILVGFVPGLVTFNVTIGLSGLVAKAMRISSANRIRGGLFGLTAVALSGITAANAFTWSANQYASFTFDLEDLLPTADSTNYRSLLVQNGLYALGGLVTWKIGRGRWRYVAPSDLFKPGTFARRSLPASGPDYADSGQKLELQRLGRRYGCHHCGIRHGFKLWHRSSIIPVDSSKPKPPFSLSKWLSDIRFGVMFHGDHIPPTALVSSWRKQRFYPQCTECSQLQGQAVKLRQRTLILARSWRLWNLWWPLGPFLWLWLGPLALYMTDQLLTAADADEEQGANKKS